MKMKKTIKHLIIAWIIVMIIVTIDIITTVKGLELGAEEINPIVAFFVNITNVWYIYVWILAGTLVFIGLYFFINFCSWLYEKLAKRKMIEKIKIFLIYLLAGVIIILESWVIWNNLNVIKSFNI